MKKAILISIKPEWVAKILNGEKTIEIRKTMPKCDLPIDVYIYCTKDKKYANLINRGGFLTGMVVAKFTLNKVSKIYGKETTFGNRYYLKTKQVMSAVEIDNSHNKLQYNAGFHYGTYLESYFSNKIGDLPYDRKREKVVGYAWHIDNLIIKDTPLPLQPYFDIDKAPQSWQYICEATYEIRIG